MKISPIFKNMGILQEIIKKIGSVLFEPFYRVLIIGPLSTFFYEGIYKGLPPSEICGRLAGTTHTDFWVHDQFNMQECISLVQREFNAFKIWFLFSFYIFITLFILLKVLWRILSSDFHFIYWPRRRSLLNGKSRGSHSGQTSGKTDDLVTSEKDLRQTTQ